MANAELLCHLSLAYSNHQNTAGGADDNKISADLWGSRVHGGRLDVHNWYSRDKIPNNVYIIWWLHYPHYDFLLISSMNSGGWEAVPTGVWVRWWSFSVIQVTVLSIVLGIVIPLKCLEPVVALISGALTKVPAAFPSCSVYNAMNSAK